MIKKKEQAPGDILKILSFVVLTFFSERSWAGDCGYSIDASISKTEVTVGDSVTLSGAVTNVGDDLGHGTSTWKCNYCTVTTDASGKTTIGYNTQYTDEIISSTYTTQTTATFSAGNDSNGNNINLVFEWESSCNSTNGTSSPIYASQTVALKINDQENIAAVAGSRTMNISDDINNDEGGSSGGSGISVQVGGAINTTSDDFIINYGSNNTNSDDDDDDNDGVGSGIGSLTPIVVNVGGNTNDNGSNPDSTTSGNSNNDGSGGKTGSGNNNQTQGNSPKPSSSVGNSADTVSSDSVTTSNAGDAVETATTIDTGTTSVDAGSSDNEPSTNNDTITIIPVTPEPSDETGAGSSEEDNFADIINDIITEESGNAMNGGGGCSLQIH